MATEFEVIGRSVPDKLCYAKATGTAQYVDDLPVDLYVKILRSPHPHALVKSIDVSQAAQLDGVAAVITHEDVPERMLARGSARQVLILDRHLRHVGDEVAAVAAQTEAAAEDALELIEVEYEVLPAVFDAEEALKENAPKLYADGNLDDFLEQAAPFVLEYGDLAEGFAEADVIVEDIFEIAPQVHSPIEPHVCVASWLGDELTVETATQCPYEVRAGLAAVFALPESKIRVLSPLIGGGFGGKYTNRYQAIAALLSRLAGGRRTKIRLTREEEQCHSRRGAFKQYVKIGAKRDGTMVALSYKTFVGVGAYGHSEGGSACFWGEYPHAAYRIPNIRCEGWDANTNHFSSQPCRGVNVPPMVFGFESAVDELAERLDMDPIELRMRNMVETGDVMPPAAYVNDPVEYGTGELEGVPAKALLSAVADELDWKQRWKGWGRPAGVQGSKRRGIGIVYGIYDGGYCAADWTSMTTSMHPDGSITILAGTQDIGTSLNTALCQLAAEYMGLPLEQVTIHSGDTNTGQYDLMGAKSSRSLTTGGHVLLQALADLKRKVCGLAATRLGCEPDELDVGGKMVFHKGEAAQTRWSCWRGGCTLHKAIPVSEVLASSISGSSLAATDGGWTTYLPGKKVRNAMVAGGEVEVDIETGEVKLMRVVTSNCPGVAVNPEVVLGQYHGGAVMSMGYALWEDFKFDEPSGTHLTDSFTDYRLPRAIDCPEPESLIIEEPSGRQPEEGTPWGAHGVGELGAWFGPALIATAIYNATGARIHRSPMTAENVLAAIKERR